MGYGNGYVSTETPLDLRSSFACVISCEREAKGKEKKEEV